MTTERFPRATVTGSYAYGWQQFRKNFLNLVLLGLVVSIASMPTAITPRGGAGASAAFQVYGLFMAAYGLLLLPIVWYGAALVYLKLMRNESAQVQNVFDGFRDNYLNIVLANLLSVAITVMGLVLLIVPGVFFFCRLLFVPYLVMDKGLEPVAAVEKSWTMTRGHGWRIFGMLLLAIPIFILGLLCFGIGALFSVIWIDTAIASFYLAIDSEEQRELNANGNGDAGPDGERSAPA